MTLAYWCVLVAVLLPYVFAGAAKAVGGFRGKDNENPRIFLGRLDGLAGRANAAQMNSFEALPGFVAAVLVAHQVSAPQSTVDTLAMVFIALRLAYGIAYLANWASLRSLVWFGGVVCVVGLFVVGA
jgi:uncharacterized MAPEG superfamily protein